MNLLNLREQVRRRTGISSSVVSNSAVYALLNQGIFLVASKLASINEDFFEEQKVKFNLALNSALYSLPTDTMKVKQLRLAYTTPTAENDYKIATVYDPTQVYDVQAEEENISSSNPIVDITNNYFRIKPTPDVAVTNGGEIYYVARPSALALTGDTPTYPLQFHDLAAVWASKEICADKGLNDKYTIYKREYEEGVINMVKEATPRYVNRQERMRDVKEIGKNRTVTELW